MPIWHLKNGKGETLQVLAICVYGRFPADFMFELTNDEYDSLRCIFFTFKGNGRGQHSKYLPYVFTQEAIAIGKSVCENHRPERVERI
jgi:hypothetical protein